MSKLYEFDLAIGELLKGLEQQGKLDDTVIVLYSDHYPYGLTYSTLNSYFDYNVSKNLEMDRTPFIIYNSTVTPELHSEYTSYMNITPTVANLFDLDYDPRLYAGDDLLSKTYDGRVYFADGSWKDKKAYYNASSGKITYSEVNDTYTAEEIKAINTKIKNRIAMSNLAIKTDYFDHLYKAKNELKVRQDAQAQAEAEKKEQAKTENEGQPEEGNANNN
jgi:phosphoglycerol transferase MdoB-like AlkP superfamily enzyme